MGGSLPPGAYFMSGNAACVEGAIAAGCRFFAGYPISPATEIIEHMAARLPEVNGIFIQMEDEIAALAAVIGASYAGLKVMTATSGPGFSLMQENIGLAVMTETPCVIINVMRGGPSTGQPTFPGQQDVMQAKWGSHGDYEIIALAPSSVQEMFNLTIEAFNLAETYRVPTLLMVDGIVAQMWEKIVIPPVEEIKIVNRKKPRAPPGEYAPFLPDEELVPPMACFGEGYRFHVTGLTHDEYGHPKPEDPEVQMRLIKRLCDKIGRNAEKIARVEEVMLEDTEVIIIAYGIVARAALRAIKRARELGIRAGLLRLITLWPFPEKHIAKLTKNARAIIVPEMNSGQMAREVERVVKTLPVYYLPKLGGEPHTPDEILEAIRRCHPL